MRKRRTWGQSNNGRFTPKNILLITGTSVGLIVLALIFIVGRYYYIHTLNASEEIVNPSIKGTNVDKLNVLLSDKNIKAESIGEIINETISVHVQDGPEVIFDMSRDIASQVETLDTILTRLQIENQQPVLIDLHYSKPIVKF